MWEGLFRLIVDILFFSCQKYRTQVFESKSIFGIRPYKYHSRANRMV